MEAIISFVFDPNRAAYDGSVDTVSFYAEANGRPIACSVSREALLHHARKSGGSGEELLNIFHDNSSAVGRLAKRKFETNALEPNGSILIRSADLT
ncbi:MAG: DUF1488 domain-containing protein [Sphingomonadales bacterium]|nr:MAG: DUF1488 domain-containing protein [Sphingomonadales bacterium]